MFRSTPNFRLLLMTLLLIAAFGGLGYRLVDIQVVRHDELLTKARYNTQSTVLRQARRGDIKDIHGNLLATSVPVKNVCADPSLLGSNYLAMARLLAPLLKTNVSYLAERLQPHVTRVATNGTPVYDKFVILQRKVKVEQWDQICQALTNETFGIDLKQYKKRLDHDAMQTHLHALQDKAIFALEEQQRVYPNLTLASHVLGYVGAGPGGDGLAGMEGIERELDKSLSGVRGWLQTEKDRRGREIVALRQEDVEAHDGLNAVLTIDAGIQNILESEMAETFKKHNPNSIMGVVVRPRTGEILALANYPNFDPNHPGDSREDARKNKAVTDMFEPGSTFKIVAVSGALNEHVITLNDLFDCEHGHFTYAGHILREHESAGYGSINVETIMAKSSNIGAAKIGIKLGDQLLYHYMRLYGFGQKTEIRLPGEIKGWIFSPTNWSKLSMARIPIGQGITVTPLQMTMAMSAIANQGTLMRPMIVDHLEDAQGQAVVKYQPMAVRQVITPETSKLMLQALKAVVATNGTAVKARLEYYTVAGKTGTAQKAENGVYTHKYLASFIGFFPAERPELCIGILVDEPKGHEVYGGQVAAPCFKNIAQRAANYLNIQTDAALLNPMVSTELSRGPGLLAVKTIH